MESEKRSKIRFITHNRQLLFGIFLVIIIPSLVALNSMLFVRQFRSTLDSGLHRQAVLIGQLAGSFAKEEIRDIPKLTRILDNAVSGSSDLDYLEISIPAGSEYVVIASTDPLKSGEFINQIPSTLAEQNKKPIAFRISENGGASNFWGVVYPILDEFDEVRAFLVMKLSTQAVDQAVAQAIWRSFLILAASMLVIILLLATSTRVLRYAALYRRLEELDKSKDEFISIASHELRAPITAMRGYLSMLMDGSYGELNDKMKEPLKNSILSADRLNHLVEDLLNVSRLQQGRIKIVLKNFNISNVINEILETLSPDVEKKGLLIKKNMPDSSIMVCADIDRTKQVLVNIVNNAIKYTDQGSITVSLEKTRNMALIKVKDTGVGIPPDLQKNLFQKFYRVKNVNTEKIPGTGLGLWITRELVLLMKGKLFINSIEKVGTQVTIMLPLAGPE